MNKSKGKKHAGYVLTTVLIFICALSILLLGIYSVTVRYMTIARKSTVEELPAAVYKGKNAETAEEVTGGTAVGY